MARASARGGVQYWSYIASVASIASSSRSPLRTLFAHRSRGAFPSSVLLSQGAFPLSAFRSSPVAGFCLLRGAARAASLAIWAYSRPRVPRRRVDCRGCDSLPFGQSTRAEGTLSQLTAEGKLSRRRRSDVRVADPGIGARRLLEESNSVSHAPRHRTFHTISDDIRLSDRGEEGPRTLRSTAAIAPTAIASAAGAAHSLPSAADTAALLSGGEGCGPEPSYLRILTRSNRSNRVLESSDQSESALSKQTCGLGAPASLSVLMCTPCRTPWVSCHRG